MVKHVILWTLKSEYNETEKETIKRDIKAQLEALKGVVPGLVEIAVHIESLPTSNCDLMLDSTLESAEALAAYAVHPAHVHVADTYVRPHTAQRVCLDFPIL